MARIKHTNLDPFDPQFRNLRGVLRWKLGAGPEPRIHTPSRAPVPWVANDGTALRGARRPAITWLGHASWLVQLGGRSVLVDPVLSNWVGIVRRNVAPGLTHDTLPRIDAVCITHNHMDHMDAPTLRRLGPSPRYFVGRGLGSWFTRRGFRDVVEMDWWDTAEIDPVRVTFVPAQHWSRRSLADEDTTLWGGFVLEADGRRVYHAGDTAYFSGFREIGARVGTIDRALLPIGAYEPRWFMKPQHMNPGDAVQAFEDLGARTFVAMHWGTFKLTDEALDEPPRVLRAHWTERGWDGERLAVPAVGETRGV